LQVCPLCVEEQADPKSPAYRDADRRNPSEIPCMKHGDPTFCLPANREAFELYGLLNGNHIEKVHQIGGKSVGKFYLDIGLAVLLCRAYDIEDTPWMLQKLQIIHKEYYR